MSAEAVAEGGGRGDGGDKSGTGLLSPLLQEQDHLPLGDPLLPHLIPPPGPTEEKRNRHHQGSLHRQDLRASDPPLDTGLLRNPKFSRTWLSSHDINKGRPSARARPLRWTLSSKCSRAVMTSSEGLNQNPSKIRYKASSMAPLRWT